MPIINLAFTAPVNPPGATPVLAVSQLWAGLQRKIRFAHEFVPAIESCVVLDEKPNSVTREVRFKPGLGDGLVREVCESHEPTKVDFIRPDGSLVTNTISSGANGDADLHMTYTFTLQHPDVEAGSAKEKELRVEHQKMAQMAVEKSIESIRKMVTEGKIQ